MGLGLQIGGPQAVNGYIQPADQVVVYVTFNRGTVVSNQSLKQLLSPAQIQKFYDAINQNGSSTSSVAGAPALVLPFDITMTLVKSVKVLSIQNPPTEADTGRSTSGNSTLVLDAVPADAQELIFASSQGTLYLGLLPPKNPDGYQRARHDRRAADEGPRGGPLDRRERRRRRDAAVVPPTAGSVSRVGARGGGLGSVRHRS